MKKKKWLLITPLLIGSLCSCGKMNGSSKWAVIGGRVINGTVDTEKVGTLTAEFSQEKIQNVTEKLVQRDSAPWDKLQKIIDNWLENEIGYMYMSGRGTSDYMNNQGVFDKNGGIIFYVDPTDMGADWKDVKELSTIFGEEFNTFVDKAQGLKQGETIEALFNEYGVIAFNPVNGEGNIAIGILNSGLSFKDTAMQTKIEKLCGNDLMLSTVSCNNVTQYVELGYPGQLLEGPYAQRVSTAYYQITMDRVGDVKHMKLIISTPRPNTNDKQDLSKEKYARLDAILTEVTGEVVDTSVLKADIQQNIVNGKSLSGTVGAFNYSVTQKDSYTPYDGIDLTIVEFTK